MLASQGQPSPKPPLGLALRTGSFKLIENEAAPAPRSSAPTAYSLLISDVRQGSAQQSSGAPIASSVDHSSRLLPLRQVIGGQIAFESDHDHKEDDQTDGDGDAGQVRIRGGGEVASAVADVVGALPSPDHSVHGGANWVGSSLLMRTRCTGAGGGGGSEVMVRQELLGDAAPLQAHVIAADGTVMVDLAGRLAGGGVGGGGGALPPGVSAAGGVGGVGVVRKRRRSYGAWADFCQQFKQQQKVLREVARRKWWILAVPLLLCFLLCGLGVFGVVFAASRYTEQLRDYARGALASTAISTVAGQLEIATFAVMTLSAYLVQRPNCSELNAHYNELAEVIFQWDAKQAVYQLQAMPAAVVKYIHPYPDPELAAQLIGRDILKLPQYRNDTIKQIRARNERLLLGPYNLLEGFKAMFVTFAVFLPAPDPLYDWGCGVQPYECPSDTCWYTDKKTGQLMKLWGMATSLVRLDALKEGFGFQQYEQQGYRFRLWQQQDDINREALIDGTAEPPEDPVTLTLEKYNLKWVFEVSPAAGWVPSWRDPCIAAVVVGSVLVSGLVLWLLLTREKHNLLLRAMLPRKVIRQLQRGEQTVVEEYLDPVTVLFTDIVSYTEVASQLTPLQVVRLLNDLYTEFDALTDKHGVYKVETIGDAFMCVSGCPLREDPVRAAVRMACMAQDMLRLVDRFVAQVAGQEMKVKIRIGLHSGPVVAGVIGQRMPRYCLFGDTVNTASRMESNSAPMCINVSSETAELLRAGGAVVVPYMGGQATPLLLLPGGQGRRHSTSSTPSVVAPLSPLPPSLQSPPIERPSRMRPGPGPADSRQEPMPPSQQLRLLSPPASAPSQNTAQMQMQMQPQQQQQQQQQQTEGLRRSDTRRSLSGAGPGPLVLHSRGTIHVKGKGPMVCYWLGRTPYDDAD